MDYAEYKIQFSAIEYHGPELYHMWSQGMSVEQAKAKLAARGRSPSGKSQGRGISDLNLRMGLSKAVIMWCNRVKERRLTEAQKAFVDDARERASKI